MYADLILWYEISLGHIMLMIFFEMTPPFHSSFSYKCQMFYFAEPVINAGRYRPRADY